MANTRAPKPSPAPPPPPAVPGAARVPVVRVETVVAHDSNYRGLVEDVPLTERVEALIVAGVLDLLGTVELDTPRIITVHTPR